MEKIQGSNNFNNHNSAVNNSAENSIQYSPQIDKNIQADTFEKKKNSAASSALTGIIAAYTPLAALGQIDFILNTDYMMKITEPISKQIEKIFFKSPVVKSTKNDLLILGGTFAAIGLIGAAIGAGVGFIVNKVVKDKSESNL